MRNAFLSEFAQSASLSTHSALAILFAGMLTLMGLYHVVLFVYRPRNRGNVIFTALSLVGAYRLLSSAQVTQQLLPEWSPEIWLRLDYSAIGLFFALLHLFVQDALPGRLESRFNLPGLMIGLTFAAYVSTAPIGLLGISLKIYALLTIPVILYLLGCELRNCITRATLEAGLLLITTTVFSAAQYHDILDILFNHANKQYSPYGLILLVLARWLTLAGEYGLAYGKAEKRLSEFMDAMAKAISNKSRYTGEHIERVKKISERIGQALNMPESRLNQLRLGAIVHDLGKIHLPDELLDKPGKLTPEEQALVESHPMKGWEMLQKVEGLDVPRQIIRFHHERWNGSGYPDQLIGEAIPLEARVVGIADYWDAITTKRAYRDAMTPDAAFEELRKELDSDQPKFDPALIRLFLEKRLWETPDPDEQIV